MNISEHLKLIQRMRKLKKKKVEVKFRQNATWSHSSEQIVVNRAHPIPRFPSHTAQGEKSSWTQKQQEIHWAAHPASPYSIFLTIKTYVDRMNMSGLFVTFLTKRPKAFCWYWPLIKSIRPRLHCAPVLMTLCNVIDVNFDLLLFLAPCKRKEEPPPVEQPPAPKKPRLVFTDLQRRTLQAIFKVRTWSSSICVFLSEKKTKCSR